MKSTHARWAGVPLKIRSPPSCFAPPSRSARGFCRNFDCSGLPATTSFETVVKLTRCSASGNGAPGAWTIRPNAPLPLPAWHWAQTPWSTGSIFSLKNAKSGAGSAATALGARPNVVAAMMPVTSAASASRRRPATNPARAIRRRTSLACASAGRATGPAIRRASGSASGPLMVGARGEGREGRSRETRGGPSPRRRVGALVPIQPRRRAGGFARPGWAPRGGGRDRAPCAAPPRGYP